MLQARERSEYLLAEARRHDPDRFIAALFAPAERRETVLALILLNHELARVPDVVRQPMAGYIRYQWWRDALAEIGSGKPPRDHPVVAALADGMARGWVALPPLEALVDACERTLDELGGQDLAGLEGYLQATAGRLQRAILAALGDGPDGEQRAAGDLGTALGLLGVIRAVAHETAMQRAPLPPALLASAGVSRADLEAARVNEGLREIVRTIVGRAEALLAGLRPLAGRPPRARMAAFLPATLARRHAAMIRADGADPFRAPHPGRPATALLHLLAAYLLRRP